MRQILFFTVLIFFVLAGVAGASGNGSGSFSVAGDASLQAGSWMLQSPWEAGEVVRVWPVAPSAEVVPV